MYKINPYTTKLDYYNPSPVTPFTVLGGTTGTQPTFSGTPMFYGNYVQSGDLIYFDIQVDFDNILTFGTGQYYVELPFESRYPTQMRDGCVHDTSTGRQYSIGGHIDANSKQLLLNYIGTNGRDEPFEHNQPFTLDTTDNFHISGMYIKI
jgi:hypothetical protein